MSVNRERPHLFVLPEDDANRNLCNGFLQERGINPNQIRILPSAGGWKKVLDKFVRDHIGEMKKYPNRRMVLLIDFDQDEDRLFIVRKTIPDDLSHRVFILGVWSNPEELKTRLPRGYEEIGMEMALHCHEENGPATSIWSHELLRHNAAELQRARDALRSILFA